MDLLNLVAIISAITLVIVCISLGFIICIKIHSRSKSNGAKHEIDKSNKTDTSNNSWYRPLWIAGIPLLIFGIVGVADSLISIWNPNVSLGIFGAQFLVGLAYLTAASKLK